MKVVRLRAEPPESAAPREEVLFSIGGPFRLNSKGSKATDFKTLSRVPGTTFGLGP